MKREDNQAQYVYAIPDQLNALDPEIVIGRYFKLRGFRNFITHSKLRLTKLSAFIDNAEGLPLYEDRRCFLDNQENTHIVSTLKTVGNYYASCWIIKKSESYLMWRNYSNYNQGVLVQTTVGQLLSSLVLQGFEEDSRVSKWFYGEVDYEHKCPDTSAHRRAFGKRSFFREENEFRIVNYRHPITSADYVYAPITGFDFINKIICSPGATDAFVSLIRRIVHNEELGPNLVFASEIESSSKAILDDFFKTTE